MTDKSKDYPVTLDGRYFVVRGRLWRKSNPALPEAKRKKLVSDLSRARSALRRDAAMSVEGRKKVRGKVEAAKRGLGERGPVWWIDGAPDYNRHMAVNTPYREWFENLTELGD